MSEWKKEYEIAQEFAKLITLKVNMHKVISSRIVDNYNASIKKCVKLTEFKKGKNVKFEQLEINLDV